MLKCLQKISFNKTDPIYNKLKLLHFSVFFLNYDEWIVYELSLNIAEDLGSFNYNFKNITTSKNVSKTLLLGDTVIAKSLNKITHSLLSKNNTTSYLQKNSRSYLLSSLTKTLIIL